MLKCDQVSHWNRTDKNVHSKTLSHVFSKYVEACERIGSYDPVDLIHIEDSPEKEKSHEHQNYGKQYEDLRAFTVRTKDYRYRT